MAKTWDVSRTGGGTYEFSQDAEGRYILNSVGFKGINKLDLPELKTGAVTTTAADTSKKDIAALSAQTTEAFGDVQPFYYDKEGKTEDPKYITMRKEDKDRVSLARQPTPEERFRSTYEVQRARQPTPEERFASTYKAPIKEPLPDWAVKGDRRGWSADVMTAKPEKVTQVGRQNVDKVLAEREKIKTADRFGPGEWGPKPSKGMPTTRIPDRITSPLRPSIKKPKPSEAIKTQLKQVKTALNPLAKAVGLVTQPVITAASMVMGAIKETPQNKHDKQYFNVDREGGRISGNPTTDLYAGMNRVSLKGNLEKAGAKRIATREKAIAKGNVSQKFINDTNNMRDQQNDYRKSKNEAAVKEAVKKGADVSNPAEMRAATGGGGGNGGGNGGRIICTELHRTKELSTEDWIRDTRFTFKTLTEKHIKGYLLWAVPTVKYMKKYPKYREFWRHIAQHRANDIAWRLNEGKFDLLGRIYAGIGEPLCWLIGNFVGNKQINALNITNWRKA